MPGGIVVLIVETDAARVEVALVNGQLACPRCRGRLRPWGWARERTLRRVVGPVRLRPRRSRCSSCKATSVLLGDVALLRRVDEAVVVGTALLRKAAGVGARRIAAEISRPRETVRGWLRRFAERAEALAAHFRSWAFVLDARLDQVVVSASPIDAALEAIGVAARAASLLLGPRPVFSWASAMTAGALLANTSSPFPPPR